MPRFLSGSIGRKLLVLAAAVAALVLVSERPIFDSAPWRDIPEEPAPEPGLTLRFTATAYCKGTTTASGVTVRSGIAAADPTMLPLGSIVSLATHDPKYDGLYTILDTGPAVQGRILDLYIWSCYEALDFGRRPVDATILRLGWDPAATAPSLVERLFRERETRRAAGLASEAAATAGGETGDDEEDDAAGGDDTDQPHDQRFEIED